MARSRSLLTVVLFCSSSMPSAAATVSALHAACARGDRAKVRHRPDFAASGAYEGTVVCPGAANSTIAIALFGPSAPLA